MIQQTVHLFVFDTFSDWEPAFAIAGINNPAFQAQPGRYCVKTVGVSKEPVTSIGGMTILPAITLAELEPAQSAMLILPGGAGWDEREHPEAIEKTKQFLAAGVPIAAICGATAGLALAGILDDKQHTSNAREYLKATNYQGAAFYQDQPAITDENVITASAMTALEFAYQIFKKLDVYTPETLEAWYGLYKTSDPA
ncbi:MAG: type 1 glutamine amidotransferase family protein [Ktedonobacteraceae bacterium]